MKTIAKKSTDPAIRFTTRMCTADDLAAIRTIEQQSHPDPWSDKLLLNAISGERQHGIAAIDKTGSIVGFCFYQTLLDESEIHNLAVATGSRRNGVATILLDALIHRLTRLHVKRLFLEVRESNIAAGNLYNKVGFTQTAIRKAYYNNGETASIMEKVLAGT